MRDWERLVRINEGNKIYYVEPPGTFRLRRAPILEFSDSLDELSPPASATTWNRSARGCTVA
jgi:hypothetical protein